MVFPGGSAFALVVALSGCPGTIGSGGEEPGVDAGDDTWVARRCAARTTTLWAAGDQGTEKLLDIPAGELVMLLFESFEGLERVQYLNAEGWVAAEDLTPCSGIDETPPGEEPEEEPQLQVETAGFGYPVGDKSTYPAGGWSVIQPFTHYSTGFNGRHLAQDVRDASGGAATVNAPVFAPADGVVRYAGPNSSTYRNMVLIEHELSGGARVCSFFGHIHNLSVSTGQMVRRGDKLAEIIDWAAVGGPTSNTHLHYAFVSKAQCDNSAAASGGNLCGYDSAGQSGVYSVGDEPTAYTPAPNDCGNQNYGEGFLSPTRLIEGNHY